MKSRLEEALMKPSSSEGGTSKKRISETLCGLINKQIESEFKSFLIYNSMSNYLNYNGLTNGAELFKRYAHEELDHMHIFQDYLLDRNDLPCGCISTDPIEKFESPLQVIEKSFEHEVSVSNSIKEIAQVAISESDFMTYELTLQMLKEQVEEESKFETMLDKIELYKNSDSLNYFIEEEFKSKL
jgi:ferritin